MQTLTRSNGQAIHFTGPPADKGPLPAVLYFALSAHESLTLAPYNHLAKALEKKSLRVFSFDIPAHGKGYDKFKAMQQWAHWFAEGRSFFFPFFENVLESLDWLIKTNVIDAQYIGVAGLSRGGFIATHLAALDSRIQTVLGFAPLTRLLGIKEFQETKELENSEKKLDPFDLFQLASKLMHVKSLRFYIGNRDTRVSTDACYQFIRRLADVAFETRNRTQSCELFISQSVGFKGHGTIPSIFDHGSKWIGEKLCP